MTDEEAENALASVEIKPVKQFRPPLSAAMRALLETNHIRTYEQGHADGIASVERSALWREIGCFVAGAALGAIAIMRILA